MNSEVLLSFWNAVAPAQQVHTRQLSAFGVPMMALWLLLSILRLIVGQHSR